jgi:cell shape-determining protein MreD
MLQILVLGLIHDSVFDMPLGLSSFAWISWYWFLAKQRRYLVKAPIKILWTTFAVTLCAVSSIEHLILIKTQHAADYVQMFLETILIVGIFPITMHYFHTILLKLGKFR